MRLIMNKELYATLPTYKKHATAEEKELYRIAYGNEFDRKAYDIAQAFVILEVHDLKQRGRHEIDIAWIANLAYNAGKIEGIKKERARKKKKGVKK